MKLKFRYLTGLLPLALMAPAAAEVIYSNYQNMAIPTNFEGVTVTIDGGTINPFFGGVGVANNDLLQPFRSSASNLGTLRNFTVGSTIDASQLYLSTGYGGSQDHLGSTFTAGQEGYLGFKLNGSNYGWMRVVFTANTTGEVNPVIKDWAYDNSGAAIATGNVLQSAAVNSAQTVTLNSASGSFSLGSAITNTSGNTNSVVKTGAGTVTLTATNTHSGATTISEGTLALSNTGSLSNSSSIVVGSAGATTAVLDVTAKGGFSIGGTQSLSGVGTVNVGSGNALTISNAATHAVGNAGSNGGVGSQSVTGNLSYSSGSIFEWDLNANSNSGAGTNFDAVNVTGGLNVDSGAVFRIVLGQNVDLNNTFWSAPSTSKTWSNIFSSAGLTGGFNTSNIQVFGGNISGIGSFSISGSTLTWTAVPEPSSAMAGLLLGVGLLRRKRRMNA